MNASPPPHLATWLVKRLVSGPKRESLIGDLIEQHHRGRSSAWYWGQVLSAILAGAAGDARAHKMLTIRGVIVGLAFLVLFNQKIELPLTRLDDWLFVTGVADVRAAWPNHRILLLILHCVGGVCCGWIVGRWHLRSTVLLFVPSVVFVGVLWFGLVVVPLVRSIP